MTIKQKLKQIKEHDDFRSRSIKTLVKEYEFGIKLSDEEKLFNLVKIAYKILPGKSRTENYINKMFKSDLQYLKKTLI